MKIKLKLKHLSFLSIVAILSFSCSDNETKPEPKFAFYKLGLEGRIVNELTLVENKLFAATDSGLFVKDIKSKQDWELLGMAGLVVKAFIQLENGVSFASASNHDRTEHWIYKKEAGGSSYHLLETNFGGMEPERLNDFYYIKDSAQLYSTGNLVVARSNDHGITWEPFLNDWNYMATGLDFIEVNPLNGDIWTGGQNGIEGFILARYSASTKTWQTWINLLPSPSVAKDIAFDKKDANTVVIGGEHGIIKTTNNGETWTIIKEDENARFYFGVEFDQSDNKKIYATSWVKEFYKPQPLILYISKDSGTTWEEIKHEDNNLFGGVYDMVQKKEGNKTTLFLGLFKGGVYEVVLN